MGGGQILRDDRLIADGDGPAGFSRVDLIDRLFQTMSGDV
jgi:hypothetical protein